MKDIIVILTLFTLFFSCIVNAEEIDLFNSNCDDWDVIDLKIKKDKVLNDIVYKELVGLNLGLDVYYPFFSAEEKYPVIIFIHGGGFIIGEKNEVNWYSSTLDSFLEEGWVVISINYRLLNKNSLFPKNLKDVQDAVDWVYNNGNDYEFDTERIGLWGSSAGGNLALMTALTYTRDELDKDRRTDSTYTTHSTRVTNIQNRPIDFVMSFAGPTDLNDANLSLQKKITTFIIDKEISEDLLKEASPLSYINSSNTPAVLLVHGKNDIIVPYGQSKVLYDRMQEMSIKSQLISFNSGHTLSRTFLLGLKKSEAMILRFVKEHF